MNRSLETLTRNIKMDLKGIQCESEDWIYSGSGCKSAVGSCEHRNITSVSIKDNEFLGQLFDSRERLCSMLLVTKHLFEL
jgi:hypothetical protein